MKPINKELTPKQKLFADEYIKTGNALQSAIKAGYSPKYAKAQSSKMLENVGIKAYVNTQLEKLSQAKIMSAKEVLEYLSRVVAGEETETIVTNNGVYPNIPVSARDKISAAKEILKRFPADPVSKAQLRKLEADARTAEAKATVAEKLGQEKNNQIDAILDKLEEEINESGSSSN